MRAASDQQYNNMRLHTPVGGPRKRPGLAVSPCLQRSTLAMKASGIRTAPHGRASRALRAAAGLSCRNLLTSHVVYDRRPRPAATRGRNSSSCSSIASRRNCMKSDVRQCMWYASMSERGSGRARSSGLDDRCNERLHRCALIARHPMMTPSVSAWRRKS